MRPDLQQAIDLVDNVCGQIQATRENHLTILKALELIRAELDSAEPIGEPASYETFMAVK